MANKKLCRCCRRRCNSLFYCTKCRGSMLCLDCHKEKRKCDECDPHGRAGSVIEFESSSESDWDTDSDDDDDDDANWCNECEGFHD
ncbi:unnamed protein product [Caenorhabditis auriculariae]|uniref:Uncharacterized protein n=1 Tax=Caenorhabditis auriculariae TaxID=2777116 RepID=A0A8S1HDJ8_9PELO|nr:unnamed protein product [Caenorhabditis auriculariae]